MTKALLALHVIAAILAVGPVAVAASMFPAAARRAGSEPEQRSRLPLLHRICTVYAVLGIAVPVFGFATAASLHVLGTAWLIASMALTAAAALVLAVVILPAQQRMLALLDPVDGEAPGTSTGTGMSQGTNAGHRTNQRPGRGTNQITAGIDAAIARRLATSTGTFNLLWAAVTVLMILRPGSTTGV